VHEILGKTESVLATRQGPSVDVSGRTIGLWINLFLVDFYESILKLREMAMESTFENDKGKRWTCLSSLRGRR